MVGLLALLFHATPAQAGTLRDALRFHPTSGPARYRLALDDLHTGRTIDLEYRDDRGYDVAALARLNGFFADWRDGDTRQMDPGLFDLLHNIAVRLQARHPGLRVTLDVISAYRTPHSNFLLRSQGGGQARQSQHIEGRAVDIRVPGIALTELRDVAWCEQRGGVGYYESDSFVHVDTARIRYWNWSPAAAHVICK